MGYTHLEKLSIREYFNQRKPVASTTIPFNLIESLNWGKGDPLLFIPFKNSQSIEIINLKKCPKSYYEQSVIYLIDFAKRVKYNRLKKLNSLPKNRRKIILNTIEHQEKLSKSKAETALINHANKIMKSQVEKLNAELRELQSQKAYMQNRFPFICNEIKEKEKQLKQLTSSLSAQKFQDHE